MVVGKAAVDVIGTYRPQGGEGTPVKNGVAVGVIVGIVEAVADGRGVDEATIVVGNGEGESVAEMGATVVVSIDGCSHPTNNITTASVNILIAFTQCLNAKATAIQ